MRFPSLKYLKTFQVAASRQSFKLAADELFITPSAVSHQIKSLEDQLGIGLFDRGPHSLTLTEAGSSYLQDIQIVFSRLEAVTEQMQIRHGRPLVRLHIPPFFASEMLMPRLSSFMELRSDTDIRISTVFSSPQSHPAEADLSIIVGKMPEPGVESHRLFDQKFVPACAPGLLVRSQLKTFRDLNDHTLLVHEGRLDSWNLWAEACGQSQLHPKQIIRFDTMHATVNAAEQGLGVALVSSRLSNERFRTGRLVKLFKNELVVGESYYLINRIEDSERKEIQALREWIIDQFSLST